jgi:8-hydroxy-5-deazaflavin:NADPH oxidoreductase
VRGDIVVLAVPHPALKDVLEEYADKLAGKIVVDVTNPVDFETFDSLVVPAHSSAAAELADELPSSQVLKAFNTNFAATLHARNVGPNTTMVLVAGDDADAKATFISAVQAGGLDAIDAGPLSRARELEAMGFLQLKLAANEELDRTAASASYADNRFQISGPAPGFIDWRFAGVPQRRRRRRLSRAATGLK